MEMIFMADTTNVSCSGCTGNCSNTCIGVAFGAGLFGSDDDDVINSPTMIEGKAPSSCQSCTGTCIDTCGDDCEGNCSQACTNGCTGDCSDVCTLGCKGSCQENCNSSCGDSCETSCKLDCTESCMGVCEGCTGCSNTCKNECEQQCVYSCLSSTTSSQNGGSLDFSDDDMATILRSLRWKKISEFPLSPTILNEDSLVAIDDPSQDEALDKLSVLMSENATTNSVNPLENLDVPMSDYSLQTVRVTAAELVEYLSAHVKNFVLWYPVYDKENHSLSWVRTINDEVPAPVDLLQVSADIGLATTTSNGLMSSQDKINLDALVATDFATQEELDTYKDEVTDKFTQAKNDVDTLLDSYVLKTALTDQYYTKTAVDTLLDNKSNSDHLHDDRYVQITSYDTDIATINSNLDTTYNNVELTDTAISGKQTIPGESYPQDSSVDHVVTKNTYTFTTVDGSKKTIDISYEYYKYRMATASYGGLLSSTDYVTIHKIPDYLAEVRQDIPSIVKENINVSDLNNDVGYLTAETLPISTEDTLGGVKVAYDSRISITDTGFINTKDFCASNIIKNSTFALGSKYWDVSDENTAIIAETVTDSTAKCGRIVLPVNGAITQTSSAIYSKYVTLSFDIMGSADLVFTIQSGDNVIEFNEVVGSASWAHFSKVVAFDDLTVVDNTDNVTSEVNVILTISNSGSGATETELYLKNIMLQNGMHDTGWYPNPYDGNAVVGYEIPFQVDGKSVILTDGVLSSPSEIDDSPLDNSDMFSDTKTLSSNGIKSYIPSYIGSNALNMSKSLRFTEIYNSPLGYGLIMDKTSTMFMIRATNIDDALNDAIRQKEVTITNDDGNETTEMVDDIPFRIDLQNNTCNINGTAQSANQAQFASYAACDSAGRFIMDTYVTIDEFNSVLEQLKNAIDALNDLKDDAET